MLFECLDLQVPLVASDIKSWFCKSQEGLNVVLNRCLGQVILELILPV